ncbi:ROK family transcriptional regulator [Homoserinibacter sp. GY 40078]|uniref:ROK family transcriptional regulator n=1 Tax=Homoserinibacter sp. GY 40078 TaxID=2603275 RepID=UPI0011C8078E|nr:ROK family transcriptional regulator [Homoserinibacter sp. GY 40078]TXK19697.1 ROK family transcriptional regulator [Homoserinibacter sp. GY 40078]
MGSSTSARGDLAASAVLVLLGTRGPMPRADIARALAVSPASVTQVTRDLIARGLVEELHQRPSQGGRPGRVLGLVESAAGAIGVKVASDHVAVVDVDIDGSVTRSTSHAFDASAPNALDALTQLLGSAVDDHPGRLLGVGVGVPGSVADQDSGVVQAPTMGWSEARLGDKLRMALGVPVLIDNDVNTLAAAERLYGVGREYGSYMLVTIGRGIGCGIVVDGTIYRGGSGAAGEIGHIPVTVDGPLCVCGARGCLEAYIGEDALVAQALERGVVRPRGTAEGLRQAADGGDDTARTIYADAGAVLGRTLAGIVHTLDPEIVVILGEGVEAWRHWQPGFESSFRGHLMPSRRDIPFVVEPWADDKWALGAAALVLATPFDSNGASGEQGRLVRARLSSGAALAPGTT